jgi:hypothetical protein
MQPSRLDISRAALDTRIARLRKFLLPSSLAGIGVIAIGWIMFSPGAGFEQGLPELAVLPAGIAHSEARWAVPAGSPLTIWQARGIFYGALLCFFAAIALPVFRFLRSAFDRYREGTLQRPGKWSVIATIIGVVSGLWLIVLIVWLVALYRRNAASNVAPTLPGPASPTQRRRSHGMVPIAFVAVVVASVVAVMSVPSTQLSLRDIRPGSVRVLPTRAGVVPRFDAYEATGPQTDEFSDKQAFSIAQFQYLRGFDGAGRRTIAQYSGTWIPKDSVSRYRLAWMALDSWSGLAPRARARLAALEPELTSLRTKAQARWSLTALGLMAFGLTAWLFVVTRRRRHFLAQLQHATGNLRQRQTIERIRSRRTESPA